MINPRSVRNMEDLASRMASRMTTNSTLYSSEDLEKMGVTWIGDAIQSAVTRTAAKAYLANDDCYAVLNGGPEIVNVKDLTREDIVSMGGLYEQRQHHAADCGRAEELLHTFGLEKRAPRSPACRTPEKRTKPTSTAARSVRSSTSGRSERAPISLSANTARAR